MTSKDGILLIDKPSGPTSHDVVDVLRRRLHTRRVGHAGTLDPIASGLLVCLVERATRFSQFIAGHRKTYHVTAILNEMRSTYDRTGQIQRIIPHSQLTVTAEAFARAVDDFPRRYDQRPPAFSAKKIAGRPAYKLARSGQAVELESRAVEIYSLSVVNFAFPRVDLSAEVSAGTYIRSLVVDLAERVGTVGYVDELRRIACGPFSVDQAVTLDALRELTDQEARSRLVSIDTALMDWPTVILTDQQGRDFCNGQAVETDGTVGDAAHVRVYADRRFVGVGRIADQQLRPTRVIHP